MPLQAAEEVARALLATVFDEDSGVLDLSFKELSSVVGFGELLKSSKFSALTELVLVTASVW